MTSNLERYKKDLDALILRGDLLHHVIHAECFPEQVKTALKKVHQKTRDAIAASPSFRECYQAWYSEAKVVIKQLLPDRLADFVRYYEKPRPRKDITNESYRIEDYLQGLSVTRGENKVVGPEAAIPHFQQQLSILKSVRARLESSLFDIRQLVQADLFDSELDAASELAKKGFGRAAGAIAGVVLEKHLAQACENHGLKILKKNPTIGDLNDALKESNTLDLPQWRFIQHLADIRNLCDHNRKVEPTHEQVTDLLQGVAKVVKTVF
jgi:hypothetical protein